MRSLRTLAAVQDPAIAMLLGISALLSTGNSISDFLSESLSFENRLFLISTRCSLNPDIFRNLCFYVAIRERYGLVGLDVNLHGWSCARRQAHE